MTYYKVKRIAAMAPNDWHVINTSNNVTQSSWDNYESAMTAMRDLNAIERRKAKESAKPAVRFEPLRLVKG